MKKILFVVDENKMGGVSILLEDMLKTINLKDKKIDILVLHNSGDRLKDIPKEVNVIYGSRYFDVIDLSIKEIIKTKSLKNLFKKIILVFDMKTGLIKNKIKRERKKILDEKYDIEIAFKDGFTAVFTAFGDSIKKIHWLHYDYLKFNPNAKYKKLFENILPLFDNIISVSDKVMNDFNNIYHLEKITSVISNLVNINRIKDKSNLDSYKKECDLEFISVGRLHKIKGYDRLIDAVYKLKKDNLLDDIKFRIFGDGVEKENLENKIIDLNLKDFITLEGGTNNPYPHIKNSDLFILSSRFESFGLVVIEALTLGIPVLSTKTSVTDKLIDNNVNGLIVENSTEGLYEGIKNILTSKKKLKFLSENAKKFDYSAHNNKIIMELENLLK